MDPYQAGLSDTWPKPSDTIGPIRATCGFVLTASSLHPAKITRKMIPRRVG